MRPGEIRLGSDRNYFELSEIKIIGDFFGQIRPIEKTVDLLSAKNNHINKVTKLLLLCSAACCSTHRGELLFDARSL